LGEKRQIALDVLAIDRYNNTAIWYIIDLYFKAHQTDSIRLYLNNLIRLDPKNIAPYLIKVNFGDYISLMKLEKENLLKEAYSLDSNNIKINYELAKIYNNAFHSSLKVSNEKALNAIASKALFYCRRLYSLNSQYKLVANYQILQYLVYLKDNTLYKKFIIKKDNKKFFAWNTYAGLPDNWESNFEIDVFSIMESVNDSYNYYSRIWLTMGESSIMSPKSLDIIRFTYLRSFKDPVVVCVENEHDLVRIYWKEVNRQGGTNHGNLIAYKFKLLNQKDWISIREGLENIQFWNIPSLEKSDGILQLDGDKWILEANINGVYNIVDRGDNGGSIKTFCKELLNRTELFKWTELSLY